MTKIQTCYQCGKEFKNGNGVDHELDNGQVIEFCSIEHFSIWNKKGGQ